MASPHGNQDSHPPSLPAPAHGAGQTVSFADASSSNRPAPTTVQRPESSGSGLEASTATLTSGDGVAVHRKGKRGGKKKRRNRRQSFAATVEDTAEEDDRPNLANTSGRSRTDEDRMRDHSFYRLRGGNRSHESMDSNQALLDHREQPQQRTRRQSISDRLRPSSGIMSPRAIGPKQPQTMQHVPVSESASRLGVRPLDPNEGDDDIYNDFSPLIKARRGAPGRSPNTERGYGGTSYFEGPSSSGSGKARRRSSRTSSRSSKHNHGTIFERQESSDSLAADFDVNNPPSRPSSPMLEEANAYDEVMLRNHGDVHGRSPETGRKAGVMRDLLIDIEEHADEATAHLDSERPSPSRSPPNRGRRGSVAPAEGDVCFPQEGMSEMGEEDFSRLSEADSGRRRRRRRRGAWPDLSVLEDWSVTEKEERTLEGIRSRRVHEPIMVGGRLRPSNNVWHREEEDQLRFTYFNEEFENTMHASNLSELLQDGLTFRNLFLPDRPELSDSDSEDEEDPMQRGAEGPIARMMSPTSVANGNGRTSRQESIRQQDVPPGSRPQSVLEKVTPPDASHDPSRQQSPAPTDSTARAVTPQLALGETISKRKRYGPRPIWWLDILCPTDAEIRVIGKAFGIHPLTQEDIVTQEEREKIEMFKHYYFMNYRTFEQDANSENYLEPMNFYSVVFGEGVLTFHFSQTPHPANVRRRIRVLTDYLMPTADWISYAIIDNITDVYVPLIQKVEDEVDNIDEAILGMHDTPENNSSKTPAYARHPNKPRTWKNNWITRYLFPGQQDRNTYEALQDEEEERNEKQSVSSLSLDDTGGMLRRTGECRKKVMGLYRLLGNKADVIKGFAKRCNEQWDVAPRSEIGLYLGDIQDHIVTMTGNLSHYENLLSRAHSNYLAQINIRMNERAERTNDILGKLTVVGTIVLPMNIVTGLWGMNCIVPGQEVENLWWFYALTAFLIFYAIVSYMVAKKVYHIV